MLKLIDSMPDLQNYKALKHILNVSMFLPIVTVVYYATVAAVIFCCIGCLQLTRSVLMATVKDVCWEIIYFVLSDYHSK